MLGRYFYEVVESQLFSDELGCYHSYGIRALQQHKSGWDIYCTIEDISCDKAFVAALAGQCTHLQLDPMQLPDIIEDFMP